MLTNVIKRVQYGLPEYYLIFDACTNVSERLFPFICLKGAPGTYVTHAESASKQCCCLLPGIYGTLLIVRLWCGLVAMAAVSAGCSGGGSGDMVTTRSQQQLHYVEVKTRPLLLTAAVDTKYLVSLPRIFRVILHPLFFFPQSGRDRW